MRKLVLVLLLSALPSAAATRAGNVSALLPAAQIERAGTIIAATRGADVEFNDLLRTDDQGRIRIKLLDRSLLSIGVKSQLRVVSHDPASRQSVVELNYGKLRAQIAKIARAGGRFELHTPTAVAGVIGTDFGVDATDPDVTTFFCISGNVEIRSIDPKVPGVVICHSKTTVSVRRGQAPGQLLAATPEQMENWKSITEPDKPEERSPHY